MSGSAVPLRIRQLHYRYPDGTVALAGVNATLAAGEAVALVGANGAGKSSLLAQITGLQLPQAGEVQVGPWTVARRHLEQIRQRVGLVLQDPDDQLFMASVAEDVGFGPRNQGLGAEEVEQRVRRALEQVGARGLGDRAPQRLSGGQKRAVAIATVLAMEPELMLLDEPSAYLDPRARRQLIALLGQLPQTLLIATHDLDLALEVCPRTLLMAQGRVIADGPSRELLNNRELLEGSGLELPLGLQGCPRCRPSGPAPPRPPSQTTAA